MGLTTPPRRDIADDLPDFAPLRRSAVRLHPRVGSPTPEQSSLGGPLLWPVGEPWPTCAAQEAHVDPVGGRFTPISDPSVPMVAVFQLWRRDIPELPFPDSTDLCQILWCPVLHMPLGEPRAVVVWRDATHIGPTTLGVGPDGPQLDEFVPSPCTLSPERVPEYPHIWDLPEHLVRQLHAWNRDADSDYHSELSVAPGVKVGGWPNWVDGQEPVTCPAGHLMTVIITVPSDEFDSTTQQAWEPVEELGTHTGRLDTGLQFGDFGSVYLYVCVQCSDRPIVAVIHG